MSHAISSATVTIDHVHLRVNDLERAMAFYRDVLGFFVTVDGPALGLPTVFLGAGHYHHIALSTFGAIATDRTPSGSPGQYRFGLVYPDAGELVETVERLTKHQYPISYGSDQGVTVSIYLTDPDGNAVALYYDRPREQWLDASGRVTVKSERFDPADLMSVLQRPAQHVAA